MSDWQRARDHQVRVWNRWDAVRTYAQWVALPIRGAAVLIGGFVILTALGGGFSQSYGFGSPDEWGPILVWTLIVWGAAEIALAVAKRKLDD
jgi:hypothetical protein